MTLQPTIRICHVLFVFRIVPRQRSAVTISAAPCRMLHWSVKRRFAMQLQALTRKRGTLATIETTVGRLAPSGARASTCSGFMPVPRSRAYIPGSATIIPRTRTNVCSTTSRVLALLLSELSIQVTLNLGLPLRGGALPPLGSRTRTRITFSLEEGSPAFTNRRGAIGIRGRCCSVPAHRHSTGRRRRSLSGSRRRYRHGNRHCGGHGCRCRSCGRRS